MSHHDRDFWTELTYQALETSATLPLVCSVCGHQTEQGAPDRDVLIALHLVASLGYAQRELSLLQRTQALFDRFPHSLHPVRVDKLGVKLPDGGQGKPDPEFEDAMRADPELAEWLCPSQGLRSFLLPARMKLVVETVASLEMHLQQYAITQCAHCGRHALEIPGRFANERVQAYREQQVAEAERLLEEGFLFRMEMFCAKDIGAYLNDANDHNPAVLWDCYRCHGRGCDLCDQTGVTLLAPQLEPFFRNSPDAITLEVDEEGGVTCPKCRKWFSVRNPKQWSGRRHLPLCGQKINLRYKA